MDTTLYILTGPTAVGKTHLSLSWAKANNAEILSCDSTLFYKGMDIGTAKPTPEEQQQVPHHGIDLLPPHQTFDVTQYIEYAQKTIQDIHARRKTVLITGGSGFYLKSFLSPVADTINVPQSLIDDLNTRFHSHGLHPLLTQLHSLNPHGLPNLDTQNPRRVIKALARCLTTGKTHAQLLQEFSALPAPYNTFQKYTTLLTRPEPSLHNRIALRAQQILGNGLIEEVQALLAQGIEKNPPAASAIGYRETIAFIKEGRADTQELLQNIIQNTHRLVAKQRKFFRHQIHFNHTLDIEKTPAISDLFP